MIPKIIHYMWFGENPLPESTKKYIVLEKILSRICNKRVE